MGFVREHLEVSEHRAKQLCRALERIHSFSRVGSVGCASSVGRPPAVPPMVGTCRAGHGCCYVLHRSSYPYWCAGADMEVALVILGRGGATCVRVGTDAGARGCAPRKHGGAGVAAACVACQL
eukprot:COSAG01_NODE_4601_length_4886_cov_4.241278_5_plen_123_part_00